MKYKKVDIDGYGDYHFYYDEKTIIIYDMECYEDLAPEDELHPSPNTLKGYYLKVTRDGDKYIYDNRDVFMNQDFGGEEIKDVALVICDIFNIEVPKVEKAFETFRDKAIGQYTKTTYTIHQVDDNWNSGNPTYNVKTDLNLGFDVGFKIVPIKYYLSDIEINNMPEFTPLHMLEFFYLFALMTHDTQQKYGHELAFVEEPCSTLEFLDYKPIVYTRT